jgi:hypothetical protein
MEEEAVNTLVEGIVDEVVGEIWWELSNVIDDDAETDTVHRNLVSSVRNAVKKGIKIGRKV